MSFRSCSCPGSPACSPPSGLTSTDIRVDDSQTVLRVLRPELSAGLAAWYTAAGRALSRSCAATASRPPPSGSPPAPTAGSSARATSSTCRSPAPGQRGVAASPGRVQANAPAHLRARRPDAGGRGRERAAVGVRRTRRCGSGAGPPGQPRRLRAAAGGGAAAGRVSARLPGSGVGRRCRSIERDDRGRPGGTGTRDRRTSWTHDASCWPVSGPEVDELRQHVAGGEQVSGSRTRRRRARPDHVRAGQRRAAVRRRGDGRRAEALKLQPDHPRDGRLQLRDLRADGDLVARPTSSRPSSGRCRLVVEVDHRPVGRRGRARATSSSPITRTSARCTRPT